MFASVANMKNLFFENPDDANIAEIGEIFYLRDATKIDDTTDWLAKSRQEISASDIF